MNQGFMWDSVLRCLIGARDLIKDPKHWTQHVWARDARGEQTKPGSICAVCFCSLGALRAKTDDYPVRIKAEACLEEHLWRRKGASVPSVALFNDESTHDEVLAMFDGAIEIAKEHKA